MSTTESPPPGGTELEIDPTLPPFVQEMLRAGARLEPIRLDRHGRWWHRGNPIEHARIASLFSRSVSRTAGGTWVLTVGRFTYPVEVDDTPCFVVAWQRRQGSDAGADAVDLTLSDGTTVALDPARLTHDDDGLYLAGVGADEAFEARFLLEPYVRFVEAFVDEDATRPDGFTLQLSDGSHLPLPRRA